MSGSDDNLITVDGYVIIKGAIDEDAVDLDLAIDETEKAIKAVRPDLPKSWKTTDPPLWSLVWTSNIEAVYQYFMKNVSKDLIARRLGVDTGRITVAPGYPRFGFHQRPLTQPVRRFRKGWVFAAIPIVNEWLHGFPELQRRSGNKHYVKIELERTDVLYWDGDLPHRYTGEVGGACILVAFCTVD